MTDTDTARALTGDLTTIDGQPVYRVPLSGRDGAGLFALVDPEGLERLRQAGARFLYIVSDGHKHHYVTFLRLPSHSAQMASRAIIGAPSGRRVIYLSGDRLDLRTANLMVQPRKADEGTGEVTRAKARAVNNCWQTHQRLRRRSEAA